MIQIVRLFVLGCLFLGTNPLRVSAQYRRPALPAYDVVVLRVEFQADTTRFTTGDGTFEGDFYPPGITPAIDPLPHDAAYFEAHLAFLRDYVARVSDGQTSVATHLLPEVIRLPEEMGSYSPVGLDADSDTERMKLVRLLRQAWQMASETSSFDTSVLDPARTVFMIFHAGAGRDVELLGTTLDKTPLDIPTVFFSEAALSQLGGTGMMFKDLPVTHTALLPRTESRMGFNTFTDSSFVLELSINGILAASFFSILGAPDLFNTETGESAIGPYGLLDPQGIFAYSGLFPPEPGPWTKYYLGWLTPQNLEGDGPLTVSVTAASLPGSTVARVPVSESEYFLVENRQRDPEGDGLRMRVWNQGSITEQHVPAVTDGFSRFSVTDFVGGVVVGVDNYDFALPGRDSDDEQYAGGILIWHIDERMLINGQVNADPHRRAVDVEEADSAQDIGFGNDLGSPFDFFFEGNEVSVVLPTGLGIRFYENQFGPATIPSSQTNEGGESFVTLENFSAPSPSMTFTFRREAAHGIFPESEEGMELNVDVQAGAFVGEGPGFFYVYHPGPENNRLHILSPPRTHVLYTASPPVVTETGFITIDVDSPTGQHVLRHYRVMQGDPFVMVSQEQILPLQGVTRVPSLVRQGSVTYGLFVGEAKTVVLRMEDGFPATVLMTDDIGEGVMLVVAGSDQVVAVGKKGTHVLGTDQSWSYTIDTEERAGSAAFGRDASGLWGVLSLPDRREVLVMEPAGSVSIHDVSSYGPGPLSSTVVLADVDGDDRLDIVTTLGTRLVAFSQNGALAAGFPLQMGAPAVAEPLVAELSDSGEFSVIVSATNGEVYAFDLGRGGRQVPGFPLAAGVQLAATPLMVGDRLRVVSGNGVLQTWSLANAGTVWWGQRHADAGNTAYVELVSEEEPTGGATGGSLIADDETYNWPNPIRNGQSFFRCMAREDATIRITIVDSAGGLIDEITFEARGGSPVEYLWQTEAASGLYYARVQATTAQGEVATRLLKMAIIR